jgi:hypothetical protein
VIWIEVRALQAAAFGLPARLLLDQQPLDDYLRRGLLSVDPRISVDPCVDQLLAAVTAQALAQRRCQVGVRLSGRVTEPMVTRLHALGFRRFAVESHEGRPTALILGQAALGARLPAGRAGQEGSAANPRYWSAPVVQHGITGSGKPSERAPCRSIIDLPGRD